MMDFVLENQYWGALIILVVQIIFIYLRTLNVMYVADRKLIQAVVSGMGIGLTWLVMVSIGVGALMNEQILPVVAHLVGGAIGTVLGFKSNNKKDGES